MRTAIIITFLLLPALSFCQKYINQSHARVITDLKKIKPGTGKPQLIETDSSITARLKGKNSVAVDHIYRFNKAGICIEEKVMTGCDSCITDLLRATLKLGKYQWKKINENQYVSKFEEKLMIELPVEKTEHYYTILRTDWSKTLYDILVGK